MDAKAEKCILVSYSDEQKGYKCYNLRTKEVPVSRDVVFDKLALWYQPSTNLTPMDSMPITKDEINEVDPIDEEEIGTLEENSISFQLSKPNEELSRMAN